MSVGDHADSKRVSRLAAKTTLVTLLCVAPPAAVPQPAREALFTAEQATHGKALYATHCASCHGTNLQGATAGPLAGPGFANAWVTFPDIVGQWAEPTVDDLYFVVRTTMPPGQVGKLSPQEHAAIVAFLLERNGYPAGRMALTPESPALKKAKLRFGLPAGEVREEPAPRRIAGKPESVPKGDGPTQEELNAAGDSTRDWLYHTHDYSGGRYVRLDQINTGNAAKLQVACAYQMGEISNFQTGPIVYRGTMYVTTYRTTVALDAGNCRLKWRHEWQPQDREVWLNNRGVAIKDGYLVRGTSDGYLVALNAESGEMVWAVKAAEPRIGETFTMAPLIYEDMVVIGPAGSENAVSGWVGAFRLDGRLADLEIQHRAWSGRRL